MEQHAVPREVTSFEFKLIGFFTVKQFAYLLVSTSFAIATYFLIPVPYLNAFMAVIVFLLGAAFALYRYNERSLDVWIKNLVVSLFAPSQYYYLKNNPVPDFLKDIYFNTTPMVQSHVEASQKLNKYIEGTKKIKQKTNNKQSINTLISTTKTAPPQGSESKNTPQTDSSKTNAESEENVAPSGSTKPSPFLSGIVKNKKDDPIPNVMVYLNNDSGQPARILKTNHNGVFATFHPLASGTYTIAPKDLGGKYFFDTMNFVVDGSPLQPIDIYSRELL